PAESERRREPALPVYDPVTRHDPRERIDMQRITDRTRRAGASAKFCDLPVTCDLTLGDQAHRLIYEFKKSFIVRIVADSIHTRNLSWLKFPVNEKVLFYRKHGSDKRAN